MIEEWWDQSGKVRAVFVAPEDADPLLKISQAYGICFTEDGKVLVARKPVQHAWVLPGGTPEQGESPEAALVRELDEEVCIDVSRCKLIAFQEIFFKDNPDPREGDHFYQARFVAIIEKLKPMKPDPCDKVTWQRKLIPPEEFSQHVQWGKVSDEIFRRAHAAFLHWKQTGRL